MPPLWLETLKNLYSSFRLQEGSGGFTFFLYIIIYIGENNAGRKQEGRARFACGEILGKRSGAEKKKSRGGAAVRPPDKARRPVRSICTRLSWGCRSPVLQGAGGGSEEIFAAHLRQPGEAKKVRKRFLKRRGKTCVAEAVFFHKACSLGELPKPKHKVVGIFTTCKFMTKWRVFA